jgi:hypothetical protein
MDKTGMLTVGVLDNARYLGRRFGNAAASAVSSHVRFSADERGVA